MFAAIGKELVGGVAERILGYSSTVFDQSKFGDKKCSSEEQLNPN